MQGTVRADVPGRGALSLAGELASSGVADGEEETQCGWL